MFVFDIIILVARTSQGFGKQLGVAIFLALSVYTTIQVKVLKPGPVHYVTNGSGGRIIFKHLG